MLRTEVCFHLPIDPGAAQSIFRYAAMWMYYQTKIDI